jgi:hypothetical protein
MGGVRGITEACFVVSCCSSHEFAQMSTTLFEGPWRGLIP